MNVQIYAVPSLGTSGCRLTPAASFRHPVSHARASAFVPKEPATLAHKGPRPHRSEGSRRSSDQTLFVAARHTNESAPKAGALPKFNRSERQAATLLGLTSRSLLELAIGIERGFIASGISRTRSTCRSPFSRLAPLTLT